MIKTLLIANRGEIACRIIATARRLGLRTVAVYSDADRDAMHAAQADAAYRVGPAKATESYLDAQAVLAAARASGADAIHPGYGFLSENAAFAAAVVDAGLAFVGPTTAAIEAMGSKANALRLMARAGVPVLPGYHGERQDEQTLAEEAQRVGFPLMLKPSAGGGGKGMRVVESAGALQAALAAARREAASAFGDDSLVLERYLERPRHIEVQVFADTHGNIVHLYERDCSIQRRHQKVVEEAPAPGLDPALRERFGAVAVDAARAIDYVGAGTVEFLMEAAPGAAQAFYFMEMNTRLQVEHPVTECITGIDLVEWQLRVADGEPLPRRQGDIEATGHAIEVRVYAEDPGNQFLPSPGRVERCAFGKGPGIRVDAGVRSGDDISVHYDPMAAKIIAHGRHREQARVRLGDALFDSELTGITTNLDFLANVVGHPDFARADLDTRFIERHRDSLGGVLPEPAAVVAATLWLARQRDAPDPGRHASPWAALPGWRAGEPSTRTFAYVSGDEQVEAVVVDDEARMVVHLGGESHQATEVRIAGERLTFRDGDGRRVAARVRRGATGCRVRLEGRSTSLELAPPARRARGVTGAEGRLTAPMPGTVSAILVEVGQRVAAGETLIIVEAMKMEHAIHAPHPGTVEAVRVAVGERVDDGAVLVSLAAD